MPADDRYSLSVLARAERHEAWLLARAQPYLGVRVLEIGAGLGTFTPALAAGRELVAVEPDPDLAETLRRRLAGRPSLTVVEADAAEAPAGPFDSVVCFNVLEHIADDAEAVRGFFARLRPGGHLLLLVPAHRLLFGSIDRAFAHERRYAKSALRGLLERAGFMIVVLRRVDPIGALGWLVYGRVLGRRELPAGPLRTYDRLVPLLRRLDPVEVPLGLSLWAVARRAGPVASIHPDRYV